MARVTKKAKSKQVITFLKKINYKLIGLLILLGVAIFITTLVVIKYTREEDETVYRFIGEQTITYSEITNILDSSQNTNYEYEIYIYVYDSNYELCTRCESSENNIYTLINIGERTSNVGIYLLDINTRGNEGILSSSQIGTVTTPSIIKILGETVDAVYRDAAMTTFLRELIIDLNNR